MGCKWSSLNAPGTENPLSHPFLGLGEFPFPFIGPLGCNKNGLPNMKVKKMENCQYKSASTGCNWSYLNAQATKRIPFSNTLYNVVGIQISLLCW